MAFTFFFRDQTPLELAVKHLCTKAIGRNRVRIWDAGCAMGQEPYTLAMILAENMGNFAFRNISIYASDYDLPLLKTIEKGIYPWVELQRVPHDIFLKYFEPAEEEGYFRVVEKIRSSISVYHHDLLKLNPIRDDFSLIVCKNVLLHFQPRERIEVYRMFHKALEPGGFLVNEHTQKLPPEMTGFFEQVIPDGQLFRKTGTMHRTIIEPTVRQGENIHEDMDSGDTIDQRKKHHMIGTREKGTQAELTKAINLSASRRGTSGCTASVNTHSRADRK